MPHACTREHTHRHNIHTPTHIQPICEAASDWCALYADTTRLLSHAGPRSSVVLCSSGGGYICECVYARVCKCVPTSQQTSMHAARVHRLPQHGCTTGQLCAAALNRYRCKTTTSKRNSAHIRWPPTGYSTHAHTKRVHAIANAEW